MLEALNNKLSHKQCLARYTKYRADSHIKYDEARNEDGTYTKTGNVTA